MRALRIWVPEFGELGIGAVILAGTPAEICTPFSSFYVNLINLVCLNIKLAKRPRTLLCLILFETHQQHSQQAGVLDAVLDAMFFLASQLQKTKYRMKLLCSFCVSEPSPFITHYCLNEVIIC